MYICSGPASGAPGKILVWGWGGPVPAEKWTVHSVHCTLCSVHCTFIGYTVHFVKCTVYSCTAVQCTLGLYEEREIMSLLNTALV